MVKKFLNFFHSIVFNTFDSPPFILFSKILFGNLAGFRNNFYGRCHLLIAKWMNFFSKETKIDKVYENIANEIHDLGFSYLPFKLDGNLIKEMNKKSKKIENNLPFVNNCYKTLILHENKTLANDLKKLFNKKITSILEAYYGCGFRLTKAQKKISYYIDVNKLKGAEVYSDHWHTDSSPYSMLGIFILMDKTTEKNGPMKILNMKNTKQFIRAGFQRKKNFNKSFLCSEEKLTSMNKELEKKEISTKFTGDVGNVLICRISSCLHRATIPNVGYDRKMMIVHTFPTKGKTIKNKFGRSYIEKFTHHVS